MNERIAEILSDLERVRRNLMVLSDDIWLSINHNDDARLEEGLAFKKGYNADMAEFQRVAERLSARIQGFTGVGTDHLPLVPPASGSGSSATGERSGAGRQIDEAKRAEALRGIREGDEIGLSDDWEYKKPLAYALDGRWREIADWRDVYAGICGALAERDRARFAGLAADPAFVGRQGRRYFAADAAGLHFPIPVAGLHVEGNLSANRIRQLISKLFATFGLAPEALVVTLRESPFRDQG